MQHSVVSQNEWLAARKALLTKEKEFSKTRDALSAARRALPWVKVDKNYVFDGPAGKETLADLFGGKSQLLVYHFMLGPGWAQGCPSCGLDTLVGTCNFLDMAPKGRDEAALPWSMAWVKRHDEYAPQPALPRAGCRG